MVYGLGQQGTAKNGAGSNFLEFLLIFLLVYQGKKMADPLRTGILADCQVDLVILSECQNIIKVHHAGIIEGNRTRTICCDHFLHVFRLGNKILELVLGFVNQSNVPSLPKPSEQVPCDLASSTDEHFHLTPQKKGRSYFIALLFFYQP